MIEILFFVIGSAMGSFLGAFVWRLKEGKPMLSKQGVDKSRSMCEHCHHKLATVDLIPILSWLWLKGRCRYCKERIHWQHPVVEIITGLAFLLSWVYWPTELAGFEAWTEISLWFLFLIGLISLAIYDLRHLQIANRMIYPMIALVLGWRFYEAILLNGGSQVMRDMTLGLLVGSGLFLALFYISKEKWIGGGDVKLGFFFGAWLGPTRALVALVVGFYSAFLVVVPLLVLRKISKKQPVPFGPFLIVGIFVATLWGQDIANWYQDIFL